MAGAGDAAKLCLQHASLPNLGSVARRYEAEEGNESNHLLPGRHALVQKTHPPPEPDLPDGTRTALLSGRGVPS
jgi:hypothetical protein